MKKSIYLSIYLSVYLSVYLSICLSVSLNGQVINSQVIDEKTGIKRNALYNLEEIKVRWKKAALENCPGVPCVVTPPPPPPPSFTCGTSTVTDIDGNSYNTVLIGAQCWTASNLKVTKYSDGVTPIPDLTTSTSNPWATSGARTDYTGATGIPSGQTYVSTYGYLYNWYAVKGIFTTGVIASTDTLKICPLGWHVPTYAEWTTLETYLNTVAPTGSVGGKMKPRSSLWNSPNTGADNSSGFTALPGGYRINNGSFGSISYSAVFWSATDYDSSSAWIRSLYNNDGSVWRGNYNKSVGASVRCLRD